MQGYGGTAVANRLRKTLLRIVNQSLTQYKAVVVSSRPVHAFGSQQGIPSSSKTKVMCDATIFASGVNELASITYHVSSAESLPDAT